MITNPKVASLDPTWAPFPGFSLLFDNLGECLRPQGHIIALECDIDHAPAQTFYRRLSEGLREIGVGRLQREFLFCPLPTTSYHVTVWDGGNAANFDRFSGETRSHVEDIAFGRDATANPIEAELRESPLLAADHEIRFVFGSLVKWGESVLVARLEPADEVSQQALDVIGKLRIALSARFEQEFGVRTCGDTYRPHVSLGYFANSELATQATPEVEGWDATIRRQTHGTTLAFRSIDLYAFSDMGRFFKRANRDAPSA